MNIARFLIDEKDVERLRFLAVQQKKTASTGGFYAYSSPLGNFSW